MDSVVLNLLAPHFPWPLCFNSLAFMTDDHKSWWISNLTCKRHSALIFLFVLCFHDWASCFLFTQDLQITPTGLTLLETVVLAMNNTTLQDVQRSSHYLTVTRVLRTIFAATAAAVNAQIIPTSLTLLPSLPLAWLVIILVLFMLL